MVDIEKEKTKGEEVHEEIQRIRYGCEAWVTATDLNHEKWSNLKLLAGAVEILSLCILNLNFALGI